VVAGLGAQVQSTANIWQIYQLTGSAFYLGLTSVKANPTDTNFLRSWN